MDCIRDRFGNVLSKNSVVAYVMNGQIERGSVVETVRVLYHSDIVRIEPFRGLQTLVVRPANEVMKVILPLNNT